MKSNKSFSQAKKLIKATAKNLKSIAKANRIRAYEKTRKKLESALETAKKYGAKKVQLTDRPKRITDKSVENLKKKLEKQKQYNRIAPKYKTVNVKYYYKDKETGKRVEIASQTVSLDEYTRFKRHNIYVKDFEAFLENARRIETMEKIHDIGELIRVATHETYSIMAKGDKMRGFNPYSEYKGASLLGDGSKRQAVQVKAMQEAIGDIMGAVKDGKVTEEVQEMVNDVIALYEEYRTYYHNDKDMEAIEKEIEQKIAVIDVTIHGGNPDVPLKARAADILAEYGKRPFVKTVGKDLCDL